MKIVKVDKVVVDYIGQALGEGDTLIYPTETCYGLGCDATNYDAVHKVFAIKKRPMEKSVLVLMSDIAMAKSYVVWNDTIDKLARKYWPGSLTIVAPACEREEVLPPGVMGPDGLIAFRISSHPLAAELCKQLGQPLVSTSANIAGQENLYDSADVIKKFENETDQPDMVIDAGRLAERKPTTVVRVRAGGVEVMRQGDLVIKTLKQ